MLQINWLETYPARNGSSILKGSSAEGLTRPLERRSNGGDTAMTEGRDVTIKAYELDRLLQLALVGNQVRPLNGQKVLSEAAERLQGLNRLQDRDGAGLANAASLPLRLDSSITASPQSLAVAIEDLPPKE
jgi:hypothetical protein